MFSRREITGSENKIIKLSQAGKHFESVYRRMGANSVIHVCVFKPMYLKSSPNPFESNKKHQGKRASLERGVRSEGRSPAHLTVSTSFFHNARSFPLHPFF